MAINLPAVPFAPAYPQLVDQVSVSRSGTRAMSFVEYGDSYWTIQMKTVPLKPAQRLLVEAFKDAARSGLTTITYTPQHMYVPQAYWGNVGAAALANGNLVSVAGNSFVINGVVNGLTLAPGDLFSMTTGAYNALFRVQTGGVAATNAITITAEPDVPAYITAGAVVTFKNPVANMRVMPGTFSITDDFFPIATFTLVETPK